MDDDPFSSILDADPTVRALLGDRFSCITSHDHPASMSAPAMCRNTSMVALHACVTPERDPPSSRSLTEYETRWALLSSALHGGHWKCSLCHGNRDTRARGEIASAGDGDSGGAGNRHGARYARGSAPHGGPSRGHATRSPPHAASEDAACHATANGRFRGSSAHEDYTERPPCASCPRPTEARRCDLPRRHPPFPVVPLPPARRPQTLSLHRPRPTSPPPRPRGLTGCVLMPPRSPPPAVPGLPWTPAAPPPPAGQQPQLRFSDLFNALKLRVQGIQLNELLELERVYEVRPRPPSHAWTENPTELSAPWIYVIRHVLHKERVGGIAAASQWGVGPPVAMPWDIWVTPTLARLPSLASLLARFPPRALPSWRASLVAVTQTQPMLTDRAAPRRLCRRAAESGPLARGARARPTREFRDRRPPTRPPLSRSRTPLSPFALPHLHVASTHTHACAHCPRWVVPRPPPCVRSKPCNRRK